MPLVATSLPIESKLDTQSPPLARADLRNTVGFNGYNFVTKPLRPWRGRAEPSALATQSEYRASSSGVAGGKLSFRLSSIFCSDGGASGTSCRRLGLRRAIANFRQNVL